MNACEHGDDYECIVVMKHNNSSCPICDLQQTVEGFKDENKSLKNTIIELENRIEELENGKKG